MRNMLKWPVSEILVQVIELRDGKLVPVFLEGCRFAAAVRERVYILWHWPQTLQGKRRPFRVLHMEQLGIAQTRALAALVLVLCE